MKSATRNVKLEVPALRCVQRVPLDLTLTRDLTLNPFQQEIKITSKSKIRRGQ
jgi:hypothetical protein